MRLRATYVAVLALAASGAFAQEIRLPSGQVVPEAPVGHRQPAIKDLPPDVVREEGRPESPPTQESQKDNTGRRLKTCPGCAGGPGSGCVSSAVFCAGPRLPSVAVMTQFSQVRDQLSLHAALLGFEVQ
jgi:hypothetical protein